MGGNALGGCAILAEPRGYSMTKFLPAVVAATLAIATGACQQPTAQQLNATNANSQVYIGALSCNVSGGSSYVFGSTKDLSCVYLTKATA